MGPTSKKADKTAESTKARLMRKALLLVLATLLLVGVVPAGAATATSNVDCPDTDGRERLTLEGSKSTFDAPMPFPGLAATAEFTGGVSAYRRAVWQYRANVAPVDAADVVVDLTWADPVSDYDIFVTDAEGFEMARSDALNAETGPSEQAGFSIGHCELFTIAVTNFAGQPGQALDLEIKVVPAPNAKTLACAEGDTALGCQGKAAGEAPDAAADRRDLYYLGGDPGQGSMIHTQAGAEEVPFRSALTKTRPTSNRPNSYIAPPVGFTTYRNPFQAYFTTGFEQPRDIAGDVTSLVWVSSQTMNQGGTLIAELFVDGGASVGRLEIPGSAIGQNPTAVPLRFASVAAPAAEDLTLQLAAEPVASSKGTTSSPGNATFTVHYGSVQFPSRVTLP
jgi:hypothetical protein